MTNMQSGANDVVTLEEVHRLLADTEFVSADELAPFVDLREPATPADHDRPVEPGSAALPKRR